MYEDLATLAEGIVQSVIKSEDAVLYIMSYEDALRRWKKREELEELEYGCE